MPTFMNVLSFTMDASSNNFRLSDNAFRVNFSNTLSNFFNKFSICAGFGSAGKCLIFANSPLRLKSVSISG